MAIDLSKLISGVLGAHQDEQVQTTQQINNDAVPGPDQAIAGVTQKKDDGGGLLGTIVKLILGGA